MCLIRFQIVQQFPSFFLPTDHFPTASMNLIFHFILFLGQCLQFLTCIFEVDRLDLIHTLALSYMEIRVMRIQLNKINKNILNGLVEHFGRVIQDSRIMYKNNNKQKFESNEFDFKWTPLYIMCTVSFLCKWYLVEELVGKE